MNILAGGPINDICTLALHTRKPNLHSRPNAVRDFLLDLAEVVREINDDHEARRDALAAGRATTRAERAATQDGQ